MPELGTPSLGDEHSPQQQAQAQPDLMQMANRLFDRDGDGSAIDDIMGGLGSLFGER